MNRFVSETMRLTAVAALATATTVAMVACPGPAFSSDTLTASVASAVPLVSAQTSAIDLLRDREIVRDALETDAFQAEGFFAPASDAPLSGVLHPTVELTVLADSGLPPVFLESLAEEAQLLKKLPVRIFFKGLPMTIRPDGRPGADRVAIAERLSPLLQKGIPSAVDPRIFRETAAAVAAFEAQLAKTERILPQGFSAPAVLVSVKEPESTHARHELVVGTVSPLRALSEVALRSPSRVMRRNLRDGLEALGLQAILDFGSDRPDRRPSRLQSTSKGDER